MKSPKRRIAVARSSDNDKRKLRTPIPTDEALQALADPCAYAGSGKHKLEPRAFRLDPTPPAADDTFCDGHAGFTPKDMGRVMKIMRRGILAGLVGHRDIKDDPTVLWTVDDNGWIYEARITTPTQAIYHGYPLLEGDAFARKVIARYTIFVYARPPLDLFASLERARELYSS